jgi:hypothetical protein
MKLYKYTLDSNKEDVHIEMECISCKKAYKGYSSAEYDYILPRKNYDKYQYEIGIDEINNKIFAGKEYIDYNYLTYYSDKELDVSIVNKMFKDYITEIIQFEEKLYKEKIDKLTNVIDIINNVK